MFLLFKDFFTYFHTDGQSFFTENDPWIHFLAFAIVKLLLMRKRR